MPLAAARVGRSALGGAAPGRNAERSVVVAVLLLFVGFVGVLLGHADPGGQLRREVVEPGPAHGGVVVRLTCSSGGLGYLTRIEAAVGLRWEQWELRLLRIADEG